jgi:membrane-bound ClpP family serine protease
MAWLSFVSVLLVIVGLSLFLYGVNVYNAVIGWTGFCLCIVGVLLYVIPFLHVHLKKVFMKTPF